MNYKKTTKRINIGTVAIGAGAPVSVQSMTNTKTSDVGATVAQIVRLEAAGCEIIRVAVPDAESAAAIKQIKQHINIPLIADIHFDYKLALESIKSGADGLRLNPGNIGSRDRIREVVVAAKDRNIPIRIGVNSGSLEKDILAKYERPLPPALVESALRHVEILEALDFNLIKISIKSSSVVHTIESYELLSKATDYPLHLGVTEAGTTFAGTIKSAIGIGSLLSRGIGDTLRVSLTADPVEEVRVGWEILKALELRRRGVNVISCPTCGRIEIDCEKIALEVERRLSHVSEPVTIAVMGCVVNGPGEAKEADIGIAGGSGVALIYKNGETFKKVAESEVVDILIDEVLKIAEEKKSRRNAAIL